MPKKMKIYKLIILPVFKALSRKVSNRCFVIKKI